MTIPPFSTERLRMRPMDASDEALYVGLYTDPEIMRYIGAPLSRERAQRAFRTVLRHHRQPIPKWRLWTMVERASGSEIGIIGLVRVLDASGEAVPDAAEIGVMSLTPWHGRGLAFEALVALLETAFVALDMKFLTGMHPGENKISTTLMSKLKFDRVDAGGPQLSWRLTREQWLRRGSLR